MPAPLNTGAGIFILRKLNRLCGGAVLAITCAYMSACEQSAPRAPTSPPQTARSQANQKAPQMPEKATTDAASPMISQDVAALGKLIQLSPLPITVVWQHKQLGSNRVPDVPGPSDWSLTAVLQYSDEDTAKIIAKAAKIESPEPTEVPWQEWFPSNLRATTPGAASTVALRGERYQADDYFRPPLMNGSLIRIGKTSYFVLSVFTT
jgi:hypothetical protein